MNPNEFLQDAYQKAIEKLGSQDEVTSELQGSIIGNLDGIIKSSESSKAVLTVVLTSLIYKILNPNQDIRKHQTSIPDGYSGRTFDSKYITPFLKNQKFPAMAESGWLTRSLEQKVPYDENYSGAIRPKPLKITFLRTIAYIQAGENLEEVLSYVLQSLILQRNKQQINLARPVNLPIISIINLLNSHFQASYQSDGASRLPVLALYAVYQNLMTESSRFEDKILLPLEKHTSADSRSGRVGDIDIMDNQERVFEAIEVKHNIPITSQLVRDSFEKFKISQVTRFYILSTVSTTEEEKENIIKEIERIKNIHGCHVITNGLLDTVSYYLRLLSDTAIFINNYVDLIEQDSALKFEHKKEWNTIISTM